METKKDNEKGKQLKKEKQEGKTIKKREQLNIKSTQMK